MLAISAIIDEWSGRETQLFEERFYGEKKLNPQMIDTGWRKRRL